MSEITVNIGNKLDFKLATADEIGHELGLRLKLQRIHRQWTQQELADRVGFDVGTIKNLENKGQCTLLTFIRMTMALDCVDDLASLFQLKINSIAQLEKSEKLTHLKMRQRVR